ncbi:hypothetical protein ABL78_1141 [Leptomonas seymouri]|uniref:Leucine-rich repeat protein (LRRP) n=1 Tax=Leptomonas seymouri TaxID=5684 RepID=A0A0N1I2N3_LEPSE|nr:hypothetical protein ABL78_1141 [Leptomonas seymouri]|eukprot:KPI89761.1 hypothetical protein ABL78_1141 [Leptomonas seymouri]
MELTRMQESGVDAVTDYVVSHGITTLIYTWCATHPQCYKATIRSSARRGLAERQLEIYYMPDYDFKSNKCICGITIHPSTIFLNSFSLPVPRWMASWQAQLLCRLFGRSAEVHLVDCHMVGLEAFLKEWEGTEVKVRSLVTNWRFTACVSHYKRSSGRLFSALSELRELFLSSRVCETASLAVVDYMPSLRYISAGKCCLEYLEPLHRLYHLQELMIGETQIRDRELHVLAELPLLAKLDISACSQLTSLDPLSRSPSLRELFAAGCERVVRMAQLSCVATLRHLDVSANVFLPLEFASFLTQQPLQLQTGYFQYIRWPREHPADVQIILSAVTHLYLSHCTLPNIRWLCGAHNLEQLYLNYTDVTAADMHQLAPQVPLLQVLSLSSCKHLKTNLDFVRVLPQLSILTISPSSLPVPFPELNALRRSLTVTVK